MMYLIGQMLVFLLLAAAIGFLAGWLIHGVTRARVAKPTDDAASWSTRLSSAEADFEAKALAAEAVNARLKADLHAAQNRASLLESDSGRRASALEAALKTQALAAEALADERGQALERMRIMFETAQGDWRDRLTAAEDNAARLSEALEAVEAVQANAANQPAAPAIFEDPRIVSLEDERQAKTALIDRLEASLNDAEARRRAEADAAEAELVALRQRLGELEAAGAAPRRAVRPAPPPGEDDLQTIPGVGPAAEKTLKANGVATYRALAAMTPDQAAALSRQMRTFAASRERWIAEARSQHLAKYGAEP